MGKASDRLTELRNRMDKANHIEPVFEPENSDFSVIRWYDKISAGVDIDVIKNAAIYYGEALLDGQHYVVPVGNLETLLEQYPGITYFYQGILVDVQQSRRWLEGRLDRLEAAKHNYYMYDDAAKAKFGALKTTEASKMAKADPEVLELADGVRLMAYHEHQLDRLMSAFDNIKYVLNHVVTIRKEKLEEVWIDPTRETKNV